MYGIVKSTAGYILAFLLCIILLPVMAVIAIWIKLDSPGSVLFKQRRMGKNNIEFEIYKFRTMRTDTPKDMPTHLLGNAESFITASGNFLRKSSLDELPQLFNILKGEMAFVGPRPALWNQYDLIEGRTKLGAHEIKPGITGWAQVNGRDEIPVELKIELDGYYAAHMSLGLDVKICLMTVAKVLTREGIKEGAGQEADEDEESLGCGIE